jgi:hypothetical protein
MQSCLRHWEILFSLLPNAPRHTEIAYATYAHFIDENVFKFQIGMNKAHLLVEVSNSTNNLAEHRAGIIKR